MKSPWSQRVDEALERGEVWRAKEILRGNLARVGYDPELHRRMGELQLSLGERYDAGRSLLLAGSEDEAHEPAIRTFLSRQQRSPGGVAAGLPGRVRATPLEELPARLRHELEAEWHRPRPPRTRGTGARFDLAGVLVVSGVGFVMVLGLVTLGRFLLDVLRWDGG